MIYILTGSIKSGKTTRLSEWVKNQKLNISGVLSPIEDGVRHFYSISINKKFSFNVIDNNYKDDEVVKIGKYTFYKKAFDIAVNEIEKGIKTNADYVIIDEIGPLELQKKGFYKIVKKCIEVSRSATKTHFIFVIREPLLNEIIDFFEINKNEFTFFEVEKEKSILLMQEK